MGGRGAAARGFVPGGAAEGALQRRGARRGGGGARGAGAALGQADNSSSGELAGGQTEPQETASRSHTFKKKSFKKFKICGICKQVIDSRGISCRVCKYACHRKCEEKVVTPCFLQSNYELSTEQ
ncbi:uncharacterized protein V3H86_000706 [Mergus octosetaceus]